MLTEQGEILSFTISIMSVTRTPPAGDPSSQIVVNWSNPGGSPKKLATPPSDLSQTSKNSLGPQVLMLSCCAGRFEAIDLLGRLLLSDGSGGGVEVVPVRSRSSVNDVSDEMKRVVFVSCGNRHTVIATSDGVCLTRGDSSKGRLGRPASSAANNEKQSGGSTSGRAGKSGLGRNKNNEKRKDTLLSDAEQPSINWRNSISTAPPAGHCMTFVEVSPGPQQIQSRQFLRSTHQARRPLRSQQAA